MYVDSTGEVAPKWNDEAPPGFASVDRRSHLHVSRARGATTSHQRTRRTRGNASICASGASGAEKPCHTRRPASRSGRSRSGSLSPTQSSRDPAKFASCSLVGGGDEGCVGEFHCPNLLEFRSEVFDLSRYHVRSCLVHHDVDHRECSRDFYRGDCWLGADCSRESLGGRRVWNSTRRRVGRGQELAPAWHPRIDIGVCDRAKVDVCSVLRCARTERAHMGHRSPEAFVAV